MCELLRVAISGPLEGHAEGFAGELARQGYAPSTVVFHVRLLAHVSRWLEARGLDAAALDEAAGDAFLAGRRASSVGEMAASDTGGRQPMPDQRL
jgi:integrase/recombinase XerD